MEYVLRSARNIQEDRRTGRVLHFHNANSRKFAEVEEHEGNCEVKESMVIIADGKNVFLNSPNG